MKEEDSALTNTLDAASASDKAAPLRRHILWLLSKLTAPQIKIALRYQVLLAELQRMVLWQGVQTAIHDPEFAVPSQAHDGPSAAHAAVITGMNRRELALIAKEEQLPIEPSGGDLHRLIRIVTAWSTEPEYLDENGQPVDLPLSGPPPSLHSLNRRFGRCVPDRALADLLVKNGNAEWIADPSEQRLGKALRWKSLYVRSDKLSEHDVLILGQIASDFLQSLYEKLNPENPGEEPRFREIYFNDVPAERLPDVHAELKAAQDEMGKTFEKIMNKYRDASTSNGIRIGIGSYTFVGTPLVADLLGESGNNKPS